MNTLLTVSETLATFGDWIGKYWGALAGSITIPVVVAFIAKLIINIIKNKATIKNAVVGATNELKKTTEVVSNQVDALKIWVIEALEQFKTSFECKIDEKYDTLKTQRAELYNQILEGADKIDLTVKDKIKELEEEVKKLDEIVKEIEEDKDEVIEQAEEVVEETQEEQYVSIEDILR